MTIFRAKFSRKNDFVDNDNARIILLNSLLLRREEFFNNLRRIVNYTNMKRANNLELHIISVLYRIEFIILRTKPLSVLSYY